MGLISFTLVVYLFWFANTDKAYCQKIEINSSGIVHVTCYLIGFTVPTVDSLYR